MYTAAGHHNHKDEHVDAILPARSLHVNAAVHASSPLINSTTIEPFFNAGGERWDQPPQQNNKTIYFYT